MGNQLAAGLAADVFTAELSKMQLHPRSILNTGRFLKTLQCDRAEDQIVVKAYYIREGSNIIHHQGEINEIEKRLAMIQVPNVLPFSWLETTEKSAYITRQYIQASLKERMSMRPILTMEEKLWFIFQLLSALEQCHSQDVCHGDIKSENVLVTSWSWLLLTDFASFKPVYLDEGDPANLSFFFDNEYSHRCNIAPERFVDNPEARTTQKLTPAMDIFSMGCVIAELVLPVPLFNRDRLQKYKSGQFDPTANMAAIKQTLPYIHDLIVDMIQLDASKRPSASTLLQQWEGKVFPKFMPLELHKFIWRTARMDTDERIARIYASRNAILKSLTEGEASMDDTETMIVSGLTIVFALVTSTIRNLRRPSSRILSLRLLEWGCTKLDDQILLQRLLPYSVALMSDTEAQVRAASIPAIAKILQHINAAPLSEADLFVGYILPSLNQVINDKEVVQMSLAEHLPLIAENAGRFLELIQQKQLDGGYEASRWNYDKEMEVLRLNFLKLTFALISCQLSSVKRALMQDITRLCVFFGRECCNNELLPLLITVLNDKDGEVRLAFFENIIGTAALVGKHSLHHFILPCVFEALSDAHEGVVEKAGNVLSCLVGFGLLEMEAMMKSAKIGSSLLLHPSKCIRYAAIGLIDALAAQMGPVDTHCRLMQTIKPYLQSDIVHVTCANLIATLKPPLTAYAFDMALKQCIQRMKIDPSNVSPKLSLANDDGAISKDQQEKIVCLWDYITAVARARLNRQQEEEQIIQDKTQKSKDEIWLQEEWNSFFGGLDEPFRVDAVRNQNQNQRYSAPASLPPSSSSIGAVGGSAAAAGGIGGTNSTMAAMASAASSTLSLSSSGIMSSPRQGVGLVKLDLGVTQPIAAGSFMNWTPSGVLDHTLHEHSKAVTKIAVASDSSFFATSSLDGTVKIWECQHMENNLMHSRLTIPSEAPVTALCVCEGSRSIAMGNEKGCIDVVRIDAAPAEPRRSPWGTTTFKSVDMQGGAISYLHHADIQNDSVLIALTNTGLIRGWDLRCQRYVFDLSQPLNLGISSTMVMDPDKFWMSVGTTRGFVMMFDLRFHIMVWQWRHPSHSKITKLVACNRAIKEPDSCLVTAIGSNKVMQLDLGTREIKAEYVEGLNPKASPPRASTREETEAATFGQTNLNYGLEDIQQPAWEGHSIRALALHPQGDCFASGGSDRFIRYWNRNDANSCFHLSKSHGEQPHEHRFTVVDWSSEKAQVRRILNYVDSSADKPSLTNPDFLKGANPRHNDCIYDLAFTAAPKRVISAARDGTVKVWK